MLTDLENLEKEKIETYKEIEKNFLADDFWSCPFNVIGQGCIRMSGWVEKIKEDFVLKGYNVNDRYFLTKFDALKKAIREVDKNTCALSYEAYILKNNRF